MAEMVARELFDELVGSTLEARTAERAVELTVDRVEDLGSGDGVRFSVYLSAPAGTPLPQGTYTVTPPGGDPFPLFVVPIALEQDRYRYEAAFNREGS